MRCGCGVVFVAVLFGCGYLLTGAIERWAFVESLTRPNLTCLRWAPAAPRPALMNHAGRLRLIGNVLGYHFMTSSFVSPRTPRPAGRLFVGGGLHNSNYQATSFSECVCKDGGLIISCYVKGLVGLARRRASAFFARLCQSMLRGRPPPTLRILRGGATACFLADAWRWKMRRVGRDKMVPSRILAVFGSARAAYSSAARAGAARVPARLRCAQALVLKRSECKDEGPGGVLARATMLQNGAFVWLSKMVDIIREWRLLSVAGSVPGVCGAPSSALCGVVLCG